MGYISAMGPCYTCRDLFMFNPERVPSVVINGVREPVCEACMTKANAIRKAKGLPLLEILPGAYDAADESEL